MSHRSRKTRKYSTPCSKVTGMALESNFCQTVRFNVQVEELRNVNKETPNEEGLYFEF